MRYLLLAAVVLMGLSASSLQAATITGLFNTGTNALDLALTGGDGVTDPHYSIVSSTSGPSFAGQQAVTYYNSAYAAEDATSRWVSLSGNGTPVDNTTIYQTTFNLNGFNPATASISGSLGADNQGTILLNGVATGISVSGFHSLLPFTISSGFISGLNTLDFQITDFGVVTAFRVDGLTGTADIAVSSVPLPGGLPMMGIALALLGTLGFARSRRSSV